MPYGGGLLDDVSRQVIAGIPDLSTALDIGAGAGRYGKMVRHLRPATWLTAVEIERDYVTRFDLREVYNDVAVMPAIDLLREVDSSWDLVTAGDVLEHMRKSEGVDLLHFLIYRTRWLWLVWPERYVQGSYDGYAAEAHISVWTERDVKALDTSYRVWRKPPLVGALVRGYLARAALEAICE